MKAAEWKRLVRPIIPDGEHWRFRGSLCYRHPVRRFLFGVLGEGSGFDKGVYVWRVSMPLFVPAEVVILSYSYRIGGGSAKYNSADIDEFLSAVASGFRNIPTEEGELRRLIGLATDTSNVRLYETAAYSQVLLGGQTGALAKIEAATRVPVSRDWEREVVNRLGQFARILTEEGQEAAVVELDAQSKRTATALGVVQK